MLSEGESENGFDPKGYLNYDTRTRQKIAQIAIRWPRIGMYGSCGHMLWMAWPMFFVAFVLHNVIFWYYCTP